MFYPKWKPATSAQQRQLGKKRVLQLFLPFLSPLFVETKTMEIIRFGCKIVWQRTRVYILPVCRLVGQGVGVDEHVGIDGIVDNKQMYYERLFLFLRIGVQKLKRLWFLNSN